MTDNINQTGIAALLNMVQAIYTLNNSGTTSGTAINTTLQAINTTLAAAFPPVLTSSATYNPASVAAGSQTTTTVTVTGAALGNWADASFSLDQGGLAFTAYVSSANTVTVILANNTAGSIDLASGTLRVRVWTH